MFPFTDDEELYEGVDEYELSAPHASSTPARPQYSSDAGEGNGHAETLPARLSQEHDRTRAKSTENIASETLPSRPRPEISDYLNCNEGQHEGLQQEEQSNVSNKIQTPFSNVKSKSAKSSHNIGESPARPYWTDPSLSASLGILTDLSPGERLPKEEVSARLRELALTSESGSCSVLEVIEPSSEDSDVHGEDENLTDMSFSGPAQHGRVNDESASSGLQSRSRHIQDRRGKRQGRNRHEEIDGNIRGEGTTTSSESGADSTPAADHTELSADSKHFLVSETSVGAAVTDVSETGQRPQGDGEGQEISIATSFKRKGFLHKFSIKPRWPSKRKVKTLRKIESVNREFQETYGVSVRTTESSLSLGDTDAHTTPESNTSSSQEYSNSSEESSIGKPTTTPTRPTKPPPPVPKSPPPKHFENEIRLRNIIKPPIEGENHSDVPLRVRPVSYPRVNSPSRSPTPPPVPSRRVLTSPTPIEKESTPTTPIRLNDTNDSVDGHTADVSSVTKTPVGEVRSVAASEDSGIVARPASSASKSDSVSRPESSTSSFPPFKSDYSLQKSSLSLTHDLLPTPDSSAGRMSPAPSEISKTESALSPPSHASDVSKSESARQLSVGKGSIGGSTCGVWGSSNSSSKEGSASSSDYSLTLLPLKKELAVKTAAIISCDQKTKRPNSASQSRVRINYVY